jgi:hypothetical protein
MATASDGIGERGRPVVLPGGAGSRPRGAARRDRAPLIELLSELRSLHARRLRGEIGGIEYEQLRRQVLRRI